MMRRTFIRSLAALALGALAVRPLPSQTEPQIRDLTGRDFDSQTLIDVLKPKTELPPEWLRARGARSLNSPRAKCEIYRARGVTVKPAADIAAVEILFAFDSAALTPEASKRLHEIGKAFTSPDLAPCCFRIEGHTDDKGTDEYNLRLSEQRARSVVAYLSQEFNIEVDRMVVVGEGEGHPIADNATDDGRQKNRRVQLVNLGYGEVTP